MKLMRFRVFDLAAPLLLGFACHASAPSNEPPMQGVSAETSSDLSVLITVIEHIRGAESAEIIGVERDVFIPDVSLRDRSPERHSPAVIKQLWKKTWIDPPSPGDSLVDVRLQFISPYSSSL